ncbi:MAG: NADH-quinone oxidoreductase subunit L [Thaumarchaeota archaeon]|nr:NADH-quinone oxidoreductase subunit L [Nitrososphaerota archaeon]
MTYEAAQLTFETLTPWLVWFIPMLGAILTPLIAKAGDKARNYFAVAVSLLSALLAASMLPAALGGNVIHHQVEWIPALKITAGVLADPIAVLMANIVAWISFLIMVYSIGYMKDETSLTRYWFFMNFFIGNMQLIVLSDNFLQLFFGWEGVGLCSYGLIGFWNRDEEKHWVGTPGHTVWGVPQAYSPTHAGMKAFITTRIGDISFLIGLLILYSVAGTFDFIHLAENKQWASSLAAMGLLIPVGVLIFGGAIGKSAQFPLHEWLPDAMAGPTAVSALIHAATMVKAGVFLMARAGPIFYSAGSGLGVTGFFEAIAWIGAFTAFLAATQAMVAKEVKKVLAYSTVSQIGYMMLGMGVAGLVADFATGYVAGFFHLTSHAIFKAAMFMGAGALIHATETKYMNEMGGLRKSMRITYISMLLAAAGLAGVPLFSGFWSKDAILGATLSVNTPSAVPLTILASATVFITAFYSFRMIGMIFHGEPSHHLEKLEEHGHHIHEAPRVMWLPYAILAVATVAIGLTGPFFEGALHSIAGSSLEKVFELHVEEEGFKLNFVALGISIAGLGVGAFPAYRYYIARTADPSSLVSGGFLAALYRFLENRWYINALYYKVFVYPSVTIGRGLFKVFETGVIDRLSGAAASSSIAVSSVGNWIDVNIIDWFANGTAAAGTVMSRTARRIQSGVTEQYVFIFVIGIIIVILAVLALGSEMN